MSSGVQQESVTWQVIFWLGDWATLMAFWVALTGSFRWTELLIGVGASLIGSILSVATEAMTLARFLPHWRYAWRSRSVLWQIPLGVIVVSLELLRHGRHATGRVHSLPFDPGRDNAESQARRAVAEAFPTMAPASVVIGVDRARKAVIFHLLGTGSPPPTLRRLGETE